MDALLRLLALCFRGSAAAADEPELVVHITGVETTEALSKRSKADAHCIPEVFRKAYGTVVPGSVALREAVCLTQDVAVLGDASVEGDSCITGNVLVAGSVSAKGSICITGNVLVLGSALAEGDVCVTGNAFVQGDLAVRGKLKVGGKLCVFGSKDIQPAA